MVLEANSHGTLVELSYAGRARPRSMDAKERAGVIDRSAVAVKVPLRAYTVIAA